METQLRRREQEEENGKSKEARTCLLQQLFKLRRQVENGEKSKKALIHSKSNSTLTEKM